MSMQVSLKHVILNLTKWSFLGGKTPTNHLNNWDPIWPSKSILTCQRFGGVPFVLPALSAMFAPWAAPWRLCGAVAPSRPGSGPAAAMGTELDETFFE